MAETVLHPQMSDLDRLRAVRDQIDVLLGAHRTPHLLGPNGERIELPTAAVEALRMLIDAMATGQSVTLLSHDEQLTTQQVADLLQVSRPHLIKLLERDEIPFYRVGTHRRIKIEDVLAYRDRRRAERKAGLDELARLSEELPGGYR